jgi:hypothetical protein
VHWKSAAEARLLAYLLERNVRVRHALQAFSIADQHFDAGALVINRADNLALSTELDSLVQEAGRLTNVQVHPIFSGWASKGRDLGSDNFVLVRRPEAALIYGEEVDDNAFGHLWYLFEQDLNYSVTPIPYNRLSRVRLSNYNVLLLPHGNYPLSENQLKTLQEGVRQGGRLIVIEGAVRAFADKEGFDIKTKAEPKKDTGSLVLPLKPYQQRERERISEQVLGAIVAAEVDVTHPLAFGLGNRYFSLKNNNACYDVGPNAYAPLRLGETFASQGFVGSRIKPRLKNTPVAAVQLMGEGQVVFLIDDPVFRGFWEQGKVLLYNALFF